ncbi:MAG: hypothetical protein COU81_03950 [Candidatus Portnoybacteria bacterium CG10_big_fil_rev_8_21_14_0_10_36_7]|uniref:Uncharacterized protein n=1 Tax=Candidatus Portnoybacteria bacterium CG10_big_fil_rev_8_21_14_0_10_36_7 TaxID=1974812 RepID=A0A2M8KD61_9BACT|nr:MAG: hypothetical protein COU81_03950 [Candidatus Portnoybacteria bacterium CG10_big_fil_rev_8_21_14_0_10_36_7]
MYTGDGSKTEIIENKKIELTREEHNLLSEAGPDDPKIIELMEKKGIEFDKGVIDVEVDEKRWKMATDKDYLGTGFEVTEEK